MLKIARSMSQLPFSQIKTVYEQSIIEAARREYPEADDGLLQAEMDLYDYLRNVFFKTPGAYICQWEDAGRIVSVLRLEPYRDGLLVTGLETAPSFRGKGFASRLLLESVAQVGDNTPVYAHIRRANKASAAAHRKCGFEILANYSAFLDGSTSTSYDTYALNVVQH